MLSRRMVELTRTIAGELSPDHSLWMTVVAQLQAEQGDLAGARASFDRKNAAFRDRFGERIRRYLTCVAGSAEALLACGDSEGARGSSWKTRTPSAARPSTPRIPSRSRSGGNWTRWRGRGHNIWTVAAST